MSTVSVTRFALGSPAPWADEVPALRLREQRDDAGGVKWGVDRHSPATDAPPRFTRDRRPEAARMASEGLASLIGLF